MHTVFGEVRAAAFPRDDYIAQTKHRLDELMRFTEELQYMRHMRQRHNGRQLCDGTAARRGRAVGLF